MEFHWYIVICAMLFAAGFVDSIAGGGGLISLPAYLIAGVPPHVAIATNKLSSTFGTLAATWKFIKQKQYLLKCAVPATAGALLGSPVGARLALLTDENILKIILLIILPIIAGIIIFSKNFGERDREMKLAPWVYSLISLSIGLAMGLYDGFFGPGTGTFLILAFTALLGQNLIKASSNAKIVNLTSNITALVTFLINGKVWIVLGLIGAVFNILGNWVGSGLAIAKGAKIIKPVFIVVLSILLIRVIFQ
jgi:uncharacterized membrane protein YfcA